MKELRIPIENTSRVLIGDIWVNIDIQFKEISPLFNAEGKLVKDRLNRRLAKLAGELSFDIREKIAEELTPKP